MNLARLDALLERITKEMGLAARLRQSLAIEIWPRVVGPEIARQTIAGPIRDRVLLVRTANPVLAYQITLMRREILDRYRKLLKGQYLRGIHPQIGEVRTVMETPIAVEKHTELSPSVEEELRCLAEAIPDPELADAFFRAARASALAREPSARQREQAYLNLVTADTWPTAVEVKEAWEAIAPSRRQEMAARAAKDLRAKMLARLKKSPNSEEILLLRGDLRRLAFVMGYPPTKASLKTVLELLGPEIAAFWPEKV